MSETEHRDVRMLALDAQRLAQDPTLKQVLDVIRAQAIQSAIYDQDHATREQGRHLVVAIDALRGELEQRIQSAFAVDEMRRRERMLE